LLAFIILISLFALVVLSLSVPVNMIFSADAAGSTRFRLKYSWCFGLVTGNISRKEKRGRVEKKVRTEKKTGGGNIRLFLRIISVRGLAACVFRFLKDVTRCFSIIDLRADFRIGLADPAETGLLFAFLGPATVFANDLTPCYIRVEPRFLEDILEGSARGSVRVRPIRLTIPLVRLIFSPGAFRLIKTVVQTKWRQRK